MTEIFVAAGAYMQSEHPLAMVWRRVEHLGKDHMKRSFRYIQREFIRVRNTCWHGMEHSKDVFLLMFLLTLLCTLILDDPASDDMVLRLFSWMGRNCHWCSVAPG